MPPSETGVKSCLGLSAPKGKQGPSVGLTTFIAGREGMTNATAEYRTRPLASLDLGAVLLVGLLPAAGATPGKEVSAGRGSAKTLSAKPRAGCPAVARTVLIRSPTTRNLQESSDR
jgi:hypothetical protein